MYDLAYSKFVQADPYRVFHCSTLRSSSRLRRPWNPVLFNNLIKQPHCTIGSSIKRSMTENTRTQNTHSNNKVFIKGNSSHCMNITSHSCLVQPSRGPFDIRSVIFFMSINGYILFRVRVDLRNFQGIVVLKLIPLQKI